jgi:dihydroneopterin aldolase
MEGLPMNASDRRPNPSSTHCVQIRRCEVATWIGVYEHEQAQRMTLIFDIDLDVDANAASAADRIDQTVDYVKVVQDLRDCLHDRRHFLIETLADFVAQRLLNQFTAQRVRVNVAKHAVLEGVASVGVEVERFRC